MQSKIKFDDFIRLPAIVQSHSVLCQTNSSPEAKVEKNVSTEPPSAKRATRKWLLHFAFRRSVTVGHGWSWRQFLEWFTYAATERRGEQMQCREKVLFPWPFTTQLHNHFLFFLGDVSMGILRNYTFCVTELNINHLPKMRRAATNDELNKNDTNTLFVCIIYMLLLHVVRSYLSRASAHLFTVYLRTERRGAFFMMQITYERKRVKWKNAKWIWTDVVVIWYRAQCTSINIPLASQLMTFIRSWQFAFSLPSNSISNILRCQQQVLNN